MGTAYLATKEVVDTGALTPLYQRLIVDSGPGMTTVSGESIDLRVRSLKTCVMDAICTLEQEWVSGQHDENSFRARLEALSANSLMIGRCRSCSHHLRISPRSGRRADGIDASRKKRALGCGDCSTGKAYAKW